MSTRVLVVDDSPTIRKVVSSVLERHGFEAVEAADGQAALEGELAAHRDELGQTKEKLAGESSLASKAASKWEADKQSLERAKDALAVVLAQIEDTEARTL